MSIVVDMRRPKVHGGKMKKRQTLDQYLREHRISWVRFAALAGVSRTTLYSWDRKQKVPRPEHNRRVAALTRGAVRLWDLHG